MNSHQTCLSRDPDTLTRVPPLNNRRELHASVLFSNPSPPRTAKTVSDYANIGCRGESVNHKRRSSRSRDFFATRLPAGSKALRVDRGRARFVTVDDVTRAIAALVGFGSRTVHLFVTFIDSLINLH